VPHAFGGAIAYVFYGLPRSTNDYDINIFLPESDAQRVFDCLAKVGVLWDESSLREAQKAGQVRLDWGSQKVDLFFAYAPYHDEVRRRVRAEDVRGHRLTILSGEDIVTFKVIFDRPLDWRDLERLFHQSLTRIDLEYVNHWLTAMLGADDSRIAHLAQVVEQARELMAGEADSEG
jgi:hypothetical protein